MILDNFQKSFDSGKVFRLLGAKQRRNVSPASMRRVDLLAEEIEGMLKPRLSYHILKLLQITRGGIQVAGGTRFKSPKLAGALSKAESVCCFVATVGPAVDMEVQRLMHRQRYADAYVLDTLGSMSVENIVEQFYQRMARRQAEKKGAVSLRFSPGYCDWPIQQQRSLFNLFTPTDLPEVTLSDTCLMSPRKSVSGLFGLLPQNVNGAVPGHNPCRTCNKHDCIARRCN